MKENKKLFDSIKEESNRQKPYEVNQKEQNIDKYLGSLKSKAMKENTEAKPFLTEEDGLSLATVYGESFKTGEWFESIRIQAYRIGYSAAAKKANARIAELEKRLSEVEIERDEFALDFLAWVIENKSSIVISKALIDQFKAYTLNTEKDGRR